MHSCRGKLRGFTLIELLLGIGIISVLASITITAVDPTAQLAKARNARRRSDVKMILESLQQQSLDGNGSVASGVDTTWRMLGTSPDGCAISCGTGNTISVTLYPTDDASLYQNNPSTNYGSTDQIEEYPWAPSYSRRAILKFDTSGVPSGTQLDSAQLSLREKQAYGVGIQQVDVHRVTEDWDESTVTWSSTADDYNATSTDTVAIQYQDNFVYEWSTWDVRTDVQDFVDGVESNYGWMIKDQIEDSSQAYWFFHSKEEAEAEDYRPKLTVRYTGAGESGGTTASECLDLSSVLTPSYLSDVPADPRYGSGAKTHYAVRFAGERLFVRACSAENSEHIAVTR